MLRLFLALWLAVTPAFAWAGSMSLLGAGTPPSGGGGVTFSLTNTDSRGDTSSGTATITYNSGGDPSCGAADPNRYVVVVMGRRISSANAPSSVTIAGVSATQVSGAFNSGSNVEQSDIWYAAIPTGTTCSVVVAWDPAASVFAESGIGVYRLITAHSTPTTSANATTASGITTLPAYTVPSGGASVNFQSVRDNSSAASPFVSWTNTSAVNGDFYINPARGFSGSRVLVAGSVTVSADQLPTPTPDVTSMSAAAWGP